MYGYEIVQAIQAQSHGALSFGEGVVYPVLHGLEKDGALKSRRREVSGRSRVYYSLTSRGVRRLSDLTDTWGHHDAGHPERAERRAEMSAPFEALEDRLLRGGIAPRHVKRYLRELHEHLIRHFRSARSGGA